VLEVDLKRKRISLTMRLRDDARAAAPGKPAGDRPLSQRERQHMVDKPKPSAAKAPDNALAAALNKAGFGVRK
jgi:protein Tex